MAIVVRHNFALAIAALSFIGLAFLCCVALGGYLVSETILGNPLEGSPLSAPRWVLALIGLGFPALLWWEFRDLRSAYGYFETYVLDEEGVVVTHLNGVNEALSWADIDGGDNPMPGLVRLNSRKLRRPIALWPTGVEALFPRGGAAATGVYGAAVRLAKRKLGATLVLRESSRWVA